MAQKPSIPKGTSVTGRNATIIGQQAGVLTEAFVRDLLAEKDRQIDALLKIIGK